MKHDMIIFTKVFDLLDWLLPKSEKFPRSYRFTVVQRLMDAALDLQEHLFKAQSQRGRQRHDSLLQADASLSCVRLYLRLAHRWRWLSRGQYHHASTVVAEIGKLLGGWIKQSHSTIEYPAW